MAYSIKIKNKLYKSFCKEKDPHKKENYEKQFKTYRNLISTLLRETKESYYKQYFSDNKKNLKLVWQTIKGIINIKNKSDESISSLLIDNQLITSAKQISNHFNNFFASVAEKKCDKLDCNNYRPISLLSNISKIFEKSMHICLVNFLRKNKLLFCYQFGFRNGYSVNHALISLTELIRN